MLFHKRVEAFDSPDYIFELKLDGIRCLAYLDSNSTDLRNKQNLGLNTRFPELGDMHLAAKTRCILDGELFVMRSGRPDFEAIQPRIAMSNNFRITNAAKQSPASYVAFDILYCDNRQVTALPLLDRKELLSKAIKESERIALSRFIPEHGAQLFEFTKQEKLEGVVAKLRNSLYYPGKSTTSWLKIKNLIEDSYVVCGYMHKPDGMSSIVVAQMDNDGRLIYKGHVTLGVRGEAFRLIRSMPEREAPPLPAPPGNNKAIWIEPRLIADVQYLETTSDGNLRHAVLLGVHQIQ